MRREKGLDLVRAWGVLGVIAFHFYIHSNSNSQLFLVHENGSWGSTVNAMFFILSGVVLQLNYGKESSINLKQFYYKRWKSIMPAYLFSFACTFVLQGLKANTWFHIQVPAYRIVYSLLGIDGYLNMFFPTFFLVGEWFLSVILILYAMYPLMNWFMRKFTYLTLLVLSALYVMIFYVDFFGVPHTVNLIPCLLSMYIGMLIAKDPGFMKNLSVVKFCSLWAAAFILVPIGKSLLIEENLIGAALLIVLNYFGKYLDKYPLLDRFVSFVSHSSFYIFLIQHRLIIKVLYKYNPSSTLISLFLLLGIMAASLIFSFFFDKIIKWILRRKLFQKLDKIFLGTGE